MSICFGVLGLSVVLCFLSFRFLLLHLCGVFSDRKRCNFPFSLSFCISGRLHFRASGFKRWFLPLVHFLHFRAFSGCFWACSRLFCNNRAWEVRCVILHFFSASFCGFFSRSLCHSFFCIISLALGWCFVLHRFLLFFPFLSI